MMEKSFLMVKPDGVQRGLIGEIIRRFEGKGLQLVGCKLMVISQEQAKKHYAEHEGKDFFDRLVRFISSGPVLAMVWAGDDVIALSRLMMGKTKPIDAMPGTIRGDYALHTNFNLIHGSDSPESAEREIALFFKPEELLDYNMDIRTWI